jgi:hypothetical protein
LDNASYRIRRGDEWLVATQYDAFSAKVYGVFSKREESAMRLHPDQVEYIRANFKGGEADLVTE